MDDESQEWIRWLASLEMVGTWPPLDSGGRLSPAMRHILERNGSKEFLGHLKMRNVSLVGGLTYLNSSTDQHLINDIKELRVSTDRGIRCLCETALPCLASASLGLLPLLQLNDPDDPQWNFLSQFGVLTAVSLELYARQIRYLKASNDQRIAKEMAPKIYRSMADLPNLTSSNLYVLDSSMG